MESEGTAAAQAEPAGTTTEAALAIPGEWERINRGSIVLATEGPSEGWWEAVVTEVKDGDLFLVKWRDWPDEAPLLRQRGQLGLALPAMLSAGK